MNTDLILINGDIVDRKEGLIEYCDRGHQFGDGVFEIVPVYNGKVFGMIPHMENLFTSVTRLKIPAVYMVEELVEFHEALIKATGMENGEIYTQITRGSAPFGPEGAEEGYAPAPKPQNAAPARTSSPPPSGPDNNGFDDDIPF